MTKTRETRTRAEAKKLMWEYYRDNKTSLPKWIGEFREDILADLVVGVQVEHSFANVVRNAEQDTEDRLAA